MKQLGSQPRLSPDAGSGRGELAFSLLHSTLGLASIVLTVVVVPVILVIISIIGVLAIR